jgi:hypothetical protein
MTTRLPAHLSVATLLLAAVALLPGCKQDAAPEAAAAGQILPGSASDAMLPTDRLTSQPPLDPRADRGGNGGDADEKATDTPARPQGAAEPAAEPTGPAD